MDISKFVPEMGDIFYVLRLPGFCRSAKTDVVLFVRHRNSVVRLSWSEKDLRPSPPMFRCAVTWCCEFHIEFPRLPLLLRLPVLLLDLKLLCSRGYFGQKRLCRVVRWQRCLLECLFLPRGSCVLISRKSPLFGLLYVFVP